MTSTVEEIEKLLNKLNPRKITRSGSSSPKSVEGVRKTFGNTIIFKKSMEDCKVPTSWKEANVTPILIYKKGGKKSASNCRLVSLTSVTRKSMERLVRDKIMNHVDINQLLVDNQNGFRNNRSTAFYRCPIFYFRHGPT